MEIPHMLKSDTLNTRHIGQVGWVQWCSVNFMKEV